MVVVLRTSVNVTRVVEIVCSTLTSNSMGVEWLHEKSKLLRKSGCQHNESSPTEAAMHRSAKVAPASRRSGPIKLALYSNFAHHVAVVCLCRAVTVIYIELAVRSRYAPRTIVGGCSWLRDNNVTTTTTGPRSRASTRHHGQHNREASNNTRRVHPKSY